MQEIADYIGDSFYLSKVAVGLEEQTIVFCGVSFMGESAKVLNPEKTVLMPDMDGFAVMEQLQANPDYADIPVIFLTADEREEVKNKGLALGAKGFMGKPLVAEEMLAGIAAVLG